MSLDPVMAAQREREQQRFERERDSQQDQRGEREFQAATEAHEHEIRIGLERGWRGGWGDRITWTWILFFCAIVFVNWILVLYLNGSTHFYHWHLGYPPTKPG